MNTLLLLNGPNLGRLGQRKPEIYGCTTLAQIEAMVTGVIAPAGWSLVSLQSNAESELIDCLERHRDAVGAIVNPGALMMAGWSLRDALEDFPTPWIEVHLSNVWTREAFRHVSVLSSLAAGVICGLGPMGYSLAAHALLGLRDAAQAIPLHDREKRP